MRYHFCCEAYAAMRWHVNIFDIVITMRLNLHTDFGFRALILLASRPDVWITTADMARTLGIPRNHLQKVVQHMLELGWVEAKRGPSGGVRFLPATRHTTVGDVVRGLEQNLRLVECFEADGGRCPLTATCRLTSVLRRARDAFLQELDTTTVEELLPRQEHMNALFGLASESG